MAREVKISVKMSGAKEASGEVREIKNVFDQLDAAASRDISNIQRTLNSVNARQAVAALKSLGETGEIDNAVKQLQAIKQAANGIDDSKIRQFSSVLQSEMDAAANAGEDYLNVLRRFKPELDQLAGNLKSGSISQEDYNRRVAALPPVMQQAIADSRRFGTEIKGVGEEVEKASNQFDKLKNAGATIQNLGNTIQGVGQSLTVGVTLPIVGLAAGIATVGISYEQALNSFQAVTKATSEEMARASQVAKELGADVTLPATSAKDAALAMEELGKAGLNATQSMAAAKGVLQLAAAGQLEEARAAEITANALNSFSLKAEEAVRVADLLASASNASSAGVGDIAEALAQSSASFAAAKVPIEDLTSAIGLLANAGIKGSDAGTSLKTFLSSIQAPADGGATAMEKLGIKVFDAAGKFKGLPTVIGDFEKALSGLTDEEKVKSIQNIFGSDASRAAQILFKEGSAGFEKMKGAVTQAGAAAELAASKTKGVGGAFESLKSQAETIGITIYDAVKGPAEESLRSLGETLSGVSDYLSNLAQNNPQLIQMGVVFLGIAAAIGPVLVVIGTLIVAIGSVITAVGTIAGVITAMGGVAPVLAAISIAFTVLAAEAIAVGAVAYGIYAAWLTNFGNIQGVVSVFIGMVTEAFNSLLGILQPAVDAVTTYILEGFNSISEWWTTEGPAINQAATQVLANLLSMVREVLDSIRAFWAAHGEQIIAVVSTAWGMIKTVVSAGVSFIGNVIKLAAQMINGDWSGAWETTKTILSNVIKTWISLLAASGSLLLSAIKLAFSVAWSITAWVTEQAISIGKSLITGIVNGIKSGAGAIYNAAWELGRNAITSLKEAVDSHSPSREAMKVGEFVGEGLAIGIETKTGRVKSAAKKIADETIKQLAEAVKAFDKLAGASPERVQRIQQTNKISEATNNQGDIIKLRAELGLNQSKSLPTDVSSTERELHYLQMQKKAADDFDKSLKEIAKGYDATREAAEKANEAFDEKLVSMEQSSALELINLGKEINLAGVTNEWDRRRITNLYEIQTLRQQLANDGYGEKQIDEAADLLRVEQSRRLELQRILDIRKQVADAGSLEKNLTGKLSDLQNGNQQLSEYEKTLRKINEDFKDISPAQKEALLNTAAQIDAQKQFNEQYKQTYGFIRGALDVLTDSGKSFGDKMKSIFGGIAQSFKKMLLDMATQWLTSKIMGGGSSAGGSSGGIGGGIFDTIKKWLHIGGNGTGNLGGASGTAAGVPALANGFDTSIRPRIVGGASVPPTGTINAAGEFVVNGNQKSGGLGGILGNFKSLFAAKGNLLNGGKTSAMAGKMAGIGAIASLVGGFLPGKLGSVVSMAGTGMSLGANFGPWGAAIGAGIGALIGLFGGDPKKKKDKKENMPALQQGFTDAFQQFQQLIADTKSLRTDPDGALAKAAELRASISSGFGIQFLSKKYQKESQKQIALKLGEIDRRPGGLMEQLQSAADIARSANQQHGKMIPEFATGAYMSPQFLKQYGEFKRRNGMMAGAWTSRDELPSMLAKGEMVLNPMQIRSVISAVGFDPFHSAKIPGYATGTYVATSPALPSPAPVSVSSPASSASPVVFSPQITIVIEGEIDEARIKGVTVKTLGSEEGQQITADNIKILKRDNRIG